MRSRFISIPFALILPSSSILAQDKPAKIQEAMDSIYQLNPTAVGIMLHVIAPQQNINWSSAVGYSNQQTKNPINKNQPALIASCLKTYVSSTILRLVEEEEIQLDQPIGELLSSTTIQLFEEDGYDFDEIKVKHLLSHTSGIADYANPAYFEMVDKNPKYRWTRDEQLKLTVQLGNPLGQAEELFSYADANYLLLTEIIENLTQLPFYTAMRELLHFDSLGIYQTWFPTLEKKPATVLPLVHQYYGKFHWDSYQQDVSWDLYGGGGMACTTHDLALFSYSLFNNKVIKDTSVFQLIYTEVLPPKSGSNAYFLGLSEDSYHGLKAYGHGGFWGTVVLYIPSLDASVAIYVLNKDRGNLRRTLMEEVIRILMTEE